MFFFLRHSFHSTTERKNYDDRFQCEWIFVTFFRKRQFRSFHSACIGGVHALERTRVVRKIWFKCLVHILSFEFPSLFSLSFSFSFFFCLSSWLRFSHNKTKVKVIPRWHKKRSTSNAECDKMEMDKNLSRLFFVSFVFVARASQHSLSFCRRFFHSLFVYFFSVARSSWHFDAIAVTINSLCVFVTVTDFWKCCDQRTKI